MKVTTFIRNKKDRMRLIIKHLILFFILSMNCMSSEDIVSENKYKIEQYEYSKYVSLKLKTKIQKVTGNDFEENIVYLGDIRVNGQLYYILTSFKVVQTAIIKHGHSEIYILNSKKKTVKQYNLGLPEELPFKVENNSLCFYYKDIKTNQTKTFINKIEKELPELMCVEPDNCY